MALVPSHPTQAEVARFVETNRADVLKALDRTQYTAINTVKSYTIGKVPIDRTQAVRVDLDYQDDVRRDPTRNFLGEKPIIVTFSTGESSNETHTRTLFEGRAWRPHLIPYGTDLTEAACLLVTQLAAKALMSGDKVHISVHLPSYTPALLEATKIHTNVSVKLVCLMQPPLDWFSDSPKRSWEPTVSVIGLPDHPRSLADFIRVIPDDLTSRFHANSTLLRLDKHPHIIDFLETKKRASESDTGWKDTTVLAAVIGESARLQRIDKIKPDHIKALLGSKCDPSVNPEELMFALFKGGLASLKNKRGVGERDTVEWIRVDEGVIEDELPSDVTPARLLGY